MRRFFLIGVVQIRMVSIGAIGKLHSFSQLQ